MRAYNTNLFTNNDADSYYLLGLFITDGNMYHGEASLSSIDLDILNKIDKLLSTKTCISKKSNSNCYRLRINNKIIFNWLLQNGCIPNKTKVVKFPDVPKQYIPDFIRGLIDGDGNIGMYKNRAVIRFDSASLDLITKFSDELILLGINNKISLTKWIKTTINGKQIKSTTQMYRIALSGLKVYKLLKIMYYSDTSLYIQRKKEVARTIYNYFEKSGFSQDDLIKLDKFPMYKWVSDQELIDCCIKHKGVFKLVAKEYSISSESISRRLKKIGKYDFIRNLFPFIKINNLKK